MSSDKNFENHTQPISSLLDMSKIINNLSYLWRATYSHLKTIYSLNQSVNKPAFLKIITDNF